MNKLPGKMISNKYCKNLKMSCSNLKNKCTSNLGSALGSSNRAKQCKNALGSAKTKKVQSYCKLACKKCGKLIAYLKYEFKTKTYIVKFNIFLFAYFLFFIANGKWSKWGSYGTCSLSCGGGTKIRTRTCTNPKPFGGGDTCPGSSSSSTTCNNRECPSKLSFPRTLFQFLVFQNTSNKLLG